MTFEIDPADRDILVDVLEDALSELSMEIADTDRLDFRQGLKRRRSAITRTLEKMRAAGSGSGSGSGTGTGTGTGTEGRGPLAGSRP